MKRLPDYASILSAKAILLALDIARSQQKSVIISDFLFCLHSIKNKDLQHLLALQILEKIDKLIIFSCRTISFIWIPSQLYSTCQSKLTVEHLLLHCSDFDSRRSRHFHAKTLHELFHQVPPRSILPFLKDTNMYYRI